MTKTKDSVRSEGRKGYAAGHTLNKNPYLKISPLDWPFDMGISACFIEWNNGWQEAERRAITERQERRCSRCGQKLPED